MPTSDSLPGQLPAVTVIIPTIGRPSYIADTVRSVLVQDYPRLKVLISDNAPATPTAEVLRQQHVDDARIRIVTRSERLPFSEHMNACLDAADGDFVMILSDDDQLAQGYVSEQVRIFISDPKVTVGLGRQTIVTEHDTGMLSSELSPYAASVFDGLDFLKGMLDGTLRSNIATYISLFARRADILAVGGFKPYPDGSHADNLILWRLALRGRVAVGLHQMMYRVYATSVGLSTPFSSLLAATRAYTRDCDLALRADRSIRAADRIELLRLVKRSNLGMLRGRLRTIYAQRLSKRALFGCAISTAAYALTPIRWL